MDYPMTKDMTDMTIGEYLETLPDDQINGALDRIAASIIEDLEGAFSVDDMYEYVRSGKYGACLAENFFEPNTPNT